MADVNESCENQPEEGSENESSNIDPFGDTDIEQPNPFKCVLCGQNAEATCSDSLCMKCAQQNAAQMVESQSVIFKLQWSTADVDVEQPMGNCNPILKLIQAEGTLIERQNAYEAQRIIKIPWYVVVFCMLTHSFPFHLL
jgi:hypothetical protein